MARTTSALLLQELVLDDNRSSGTEDCEQPSPTARAAKDSPWGFGNVLAQDAVYVVRRRTTDDGTRNGSLFATSSSGCPSPTTSGVSQLRHAASIEPISSRHSSPGGYNDQQGLQSFGSCPSGGVSGPQRPPAGTPHRLARTAGGASGHWDIQPSGTVTPVQHKSRAGSIAGGHSAAPTPRPQSVAPTPRSSCSGSVIASPRDWGQYTADAKKAMRKSLSYADAVVLPEVDPWRQRVRACGRLLLSLLFINLVWMELQDWRHQMPWELMHASDSSSSRWAAAILSPQLPPLSVLLTLLSIGMLVLGAFTPLASVYLASRLALAVWERRAGVMAALGQAAPNLLPAKELAVVGSLVLLISYTYHLPAAWIKRNASGRYSGLEYCKAWAPGKTAIAVAGHLLVAPLFLLMLAAQYNSLRSGLAGQQGVVAWATRFTELKFWWPQGDGAGNNWIAIEALVYLVHLTGISKRRVPMLLSVLLVVEAFTCWRWWSGRWVSRSYIAYIRRHFAANVAIAGGLLLGLKAQNVAQGRAMAEPARDGSNRKRL